MSITIKWWIQFDFFPLKIFPSKKSCNRFSRAALFRILESYTILPSTKIYCIKINRIKGKNFIYSEIGRNICKSRTQISFLLLQKMWLWASTQLCVCGHLIWKIMPYALGIEILWASEGKQCWNRPKLHPVRLTEAFSWSDLGIHSTRRQEGTNKQFIIT